MQGYWNHFGLASEPFSLTPDPAFLFPSPDHAEAVAGLKLGLEQGRGLILMTGEVGTGKTTVLYYLLNRLSPRLRTAYVSNTRLKFEEILHGALRDFGVACESKDRTKLLDTLNSFLLGCAKEKGGAALVIDEAQNLTEETFEDLRLLLNFETYKSKLLQIVLAGQPELEAKLETPSLRQVRDRIAVRVHLKRLNRKESVRYIEHRLKAAGCFRPVFTPLALRLAASKSDGMPRRMNIICHNALLFAYGRNLPNVNRKVVSAAIQASSKLGHGSPRANRAGKAWRLPLPRISWSLAAAVPATAMAVFLMGPPAMFLNHTVQSEKLAQAPNGELAGTAGSVIGQAGNGRQGAKRLRDDIEAVHLPAKQANGLTARRPILLRAEPLPSLDTVSNEGGAAIPAGHGRHSGVAAGLGAGQAQGKKLLRSPATTGRGDRIEPGADTPPVKLASQESISQGGQTSRLIRVKRGTTLYSLTHAVYGRFTPELIGLVQSANPQITNPNYIRAGDLLRFPTPGAQARVNSAPTLGAGEKRNE